MYFWEVEYQRGEAKKDLRIMADDFQAALMKLKDYEIFWSELLKLERVVK